MCTNNTTCTGGGNHSTTNGCVCTNSADTCDPAGSVSCDIVFTIVFNCSGGGTQSTEIPNDGEVEIPNSGGGNSSSGTPPTPSVPMEDPNPLPVWKPIELCINGLEQPNNTTIDPEIFHKVKLNLAEWANLNKFLQENNCSEDAQQEVIDLLWEIFDDDICPDLDFTNNQCLKSVYDDLGKASAFQRFLAPFAPDTSVANLTLSVVNNILPNPNNPGVTYAYQTSDLTDFKQRGKPEIKLVFNKTALQGRPKIFIATVLMHELIHAEMARILFINTYTNWDFPIGTTTEMIDALNDHKRIEDLYTNWLHTLPLSDIPTDPHHEAMITIYKEVFISALREFDDGFDDIVYEAAVWMGLHHTKAWENLDPGRKLELEGWMNEIINHLHPRCN